MAIERRRLTQEVAAALQQQIVQLDLRPGEKLPSHADLAEALSISVPSLREGLQILAALGIVRLEHGRGTIVGRPAVSDYIDSVDPVLLSRSYSPDDCVSLLCSCIESSLENLSELHRRQNLLEIPLMRLRNAADSIGAADALRSFYRALLQPLQRQLTSDVVELSVQLLLAGPRRSDALLRESGRMGDTMVRFVDALRRAHIDDARALLRAQAAILDGLVPSDDRLICATGSIGGTFYSAGLELASVLQSRHGLTLRPSPTAGGIENIRLLQTNQADIAFTQAYVAQAARQGRSPFDEPIPDLRVICRTHSLDLWIVTPESSPVTNLQSLHGARVSIGTRSGYTSTISSLLLSLYGHTASGGERFYLSISQATEALNRGEIDVLFYLTGGMGTAISHLAESLSLRFLSIDARVIEELCRTEPGLSESSIFDECGRPLARTVRVETFLVAKADLALEKASSIWDAVRFAASNSDILEPSLPREGPQLGGLALHEGVSRNE